MCIYACIGDGVCARETFEQNISWQASPEQQHEQGASEGMENWNQ